MESRDTDGKLKLWEKTDAKSGNADYVTFEDVKAVQQSEANDKIKLLKLLINR